MANCKRFLQSISLMAALNFSAAAFALEYVTTSSEDKALTYLLISGEFSDKKAGNVLKDIKDFDGQMAQLIKKPQSLAIYLTSPGGVLDSTAPLAKRIQHWSKEYFEARKKPLAFALMIECSSACMFFSAELTKIHNPQHLLYMTPKNTTMQLHGPFNMDTGRAMERKQDFDRFVAEGIKALTDSGVSPQWLKKNEHVFKSTKGKSFTAEQICKEKSGVLPPVACVKDHESVTTRIADVNK